MRVTMNMKAALRTARYHPDARMVTNHLTGRALVRRGLASEAEGQYYITPQGMALIAHLDGRSIPNGRATGGSRGGTQRARGTANDPVQLRRLR